MSNEDFIPAAKVPWVAIKKFRVILCSIRFRTVIQYRNFRSAIIR